MEKIPQFKSIKEERDFWDKYSFLDFPDEIEGVEPFNLLPKVKSDIVSGKRKEKMVSLSIKLQSSYLEAVKKIATMKSIPYKYLVRMWVVEELKKELIK